jgi:hypothetical protein
MSTLDIWVVDALRTHVVMINGSCILVFNTVNHKCIGSLCGVFSHVSIEMPYILTQEKHLVVLWKYDGCEFRSHSQQTITNETTERICLLKNHVVIKYRTMLSFFDYAMVHIVSLPIWLYDGNVFAISNTHIGISKYGNRKSNVYDGWQPEYKAFGFNKCFPEPSNKNQTLKLLDNHHRDFADFGPCVTMFGIRFTMPQNMHAMRRPTTLVIALQPPDLFKSYSELCFRFCYNHWTNDCQCTREHTDKELFHVNGVKTFKLIAGNSFLVCAIGNHCDKFEFFNLKRFGTDKNNIPDHCYLHPLCPYDVFPPHIAHSLSQIA